MKANYLLILFGIILFLFATPIYRVGIAIAIALLIYLEFRPFLKRRKVLKTSVVKVKKISEKYPNLPLGYFGCPLVEESKLLRKKKLIELVFPQLDAEGNLAYIFSQHPLNQIRFVNLNPRKPNRELELAKEILPLIQPHLAIEQEIINLLDEREKLNEISSLVATSKVYQKQQFVYDRALTQLNDIIKKARELKNIYVNLIREGLIGLKVAQYDPNSFIDNRLVFDTQYRQLHQEYQLLKDTADAYAELNLRSKN